MNTKYILFVEDEEAQRDLFLTAVDDWNLDNIDHQKRFIVIVATNVEEACEKLESGRFDGALFDLRVKSIRSLGGAASPAGNGLALTAMREHGIPVAIITADRSVLEAEVLAAGKVEVFDKGAAIDATGNTHDRAVAWFASLWGMLDVLGTARKSLDRSSADIFLRRLWPRWETIASLESNKGELAKIVTRQYVSHMAELLGIDGTDGPSWHPFENYVSPSLIENRAHTGDIFEIDDALWVVLSPQCDMTVGKIDNVLLAKCEPGIKDWHEQVDKLRQAASKTAKKEPTEFLRRFVNQGLETSKHFLPPLPGSAEPMLVQFSKIRTIPRLDLNNLLSQRKAAISAPFLSNLVQRFGAHLSRPGQPNIDVTRL